MAEGSLPALFVSHGAPTLPLEQIPAREFLAGLGTRYPDAKAVLCVSAHWATRAPAVSAVDTPETIHDFYGFPAPLYEMRYPVSGVPDLAPRVAALLRDAGISCDLDRKRGLDHGAWVPLMLMFPDADVPAFQLSIQGHLDPARHLALGQAIAPLRREGVLVMGSGGAVHPLGYAVLGPGEKTDGWAEDFYAWLRDAVERGDTSSLIDYKRLAPFPQRAHPYPDHYMPILTAMGAAGSGAKGEVIHQSWQWGDLGMAAFEFSD
ncbi:MAG TPA: class III extradiol ring-cleavage dioxygenase [Candidatus Anoxymicrobiaceae bacterium]